MATLDELKAKVDALETATNVLKAEVGEEVTILAELKAKVDELIAAGGATAADLQAISERIDGVTSNLTSTTSTLDAAGNAADITP